MRGYGQYRPIARAAEILATRWTLIVVRNLLVGCRTLSEIADGAPGISRTLLSQRLRMLEQHGLLRHEGARYELTEAGRDLQDVCAVMGAWGARWLEVAPEPRDPYIILWALCREVEADLLPARRITVRFDFRDAPRACRRFWLVMQRPRPEVCVKPPGYDEDLRVTTVSDWLASWHTGRVSLGQGMRDGRVEVVGPSALVSQLRSWGGESSFAGRPAAASAQAEIHR